MPPPIADADESSHAEAVAWAAQWSQRWFLDSSGVDRVRLGQIDAGWATHVEAYLVLLDLATTRLRLRSPGGRRSVRRWLKSHGLDRGFRSAGLHWVPSVEPRQAELAAIVEIPTPSMLEPAAIVMRAVGPAGVVAATDPRAVRLLAADGLRPLALRLPFNEERRLVVKARRQATEAWRTMESAPPVMPLRSDDLGPEAIRRFRPLVVRSVPFLAAEARAVQLFLERVRPTGVAVGSDQHRIGRLTVAIARRLGIRSVVLQHGLPQARIGYLPVVADAVAAWSPASRDWFRAADAAPDAIVVTGNPRLDALTPAPARASGDFHVVVALSPTTIGTNAQLIRDVVASLAYLPEAHVTIKLHPAQGDWSFVDQVVNGAPDPTRINVRRHEPLYPILSDASAVVVHRSSVAVEALAARRPVIVHRSSAEPTAAELELAELELPVSDDPQALAATLRQLQAPGAVERFLADRQSQIDRIVGPRDGRSADRIVQLMRRGGEQSTGREDSRR